MRSTADAVINTLSSLGIIWVPRSLLQRFFSGFLLTAKTIIVAIRQGREGGESNLTSLNLKCQCDMDLEDDVIVRWRLSSHEAKVIPWLCDSR